MIALPTLNSVVVNGAVPLTRFLHRNWWSADAAEERDPETGTPGESGSPAYPHCPCITVQQLPERCRNIFPVWYIPRHFKISNCSIYKHD